MWLLAMLLLTMLLLLANEMFSLLFHNIVFYIVQIYVTEHIQTCVFEQNSNRYQNLTLFLFLSLSLSNRLYLSVPESGHAHMYALHYTV